jgi:hypothetical protein
LSIGLCLRAAPALAFAPPEHKEIGDGAFALAVTTYERAEGKDPLEGMPRVRGGEEATIYAGFGEGHATELGYFSFGDLVAIYGDMRATVDELNDARSLPHVKGLKAVTSTGDYAHNKPERDRMLELAYVNETHFSGKAVEAYVKWHDTALRTATDKNNAWLALHYEALALHSLTDVFAVGHMLVDRESTMQLLEKAKAVDAKAQQEVHNGLVALLHGEWDFFRAKGEASQAKLLYGFVANLYHNAFNHYGATVLNMRGEKWQAFGDHRFHYSERGHELTLRQRANARQAVSTSILQVLRVANHKPPPLPGQRYAALQYIPVRYRNAITCAAPSHEKLPILKAALKQNLGLVKDGGLNPELLKQQKIPDGDVKYIELVRKYCDKACARH